MNIKHAILEETTGDKLKAIFDRQKELMNKYHHIEARSGLLQTEDCPVNLDDKRGQARIKDFAWRMMEEVGEALDAKFLKDHYQEELIDGLHFLTELTILAGKDYNTISQFTLEDGEEADYLELLFNDGKDLALGFSTEGVVCVLVKELGMMCNCLKNKPWKQSHMKTDKVVFYKQLERVWLVYMGLLAISDMEAQEVVDVYLKKSQVNQFRQRSNY